METSTPVSVSAIQTFFVDMLNSGFRLNTYKDLMFYYTQDGGGSVDDGLNDVIRVWTIPRKPNDPLPDQHEESTDGVHIDKQEEKEVTIMGLHGNEMTLRASTRRGEQTYYSVQLQNEKEKLFLWATAVT